MISARLLKFVVCFCCFVKSHWKLFPFCCLFRGKVRLKKNFCTKKKNFFLSETTTNTARNKYTEEEEEEEREKRRNAREIVRSLLRKRSGWRARTDRDVDLGLVLHREDILVFFECSYFHAFFPLFRQEKFTQKIVQRTTWPFYSSNLIYSYSHHHITIIDRQQREQHTLYK